MKKTPDTVVLGDSGRCPLTTNSSIRCLKYWLKILKMPESRYVRKCFNYLLNTKTKLSVNWALEKKTVNMFGLPKMLKTIIVLLRSSPNI